MSTNTRRATTEPTHNGVLEVSELPTERVQRYALEAETAYLERKGGRTFLVTDDV
ncbi:hypothetical protein [Natronomonas marina]|jgi:hypothetical protein|uniref:hypothetical protein n=1 Tax=Natronomonas marina TaxID=2961939 RepID=UPI0020C95B63|nr:hypothetical protein [Natronomonas marina]